MADDGTLMDDAMSSSKLNSQNRGLLILIMRLSRESLCDVEKGFAALQNIWMYTAAQCHI